MIAARHLGKVTAATTEHADYLAPRTVYAADQGGPSVGAEQERREELVLATLLKTGCTWVWAMVKGISSDASVTPTGGDRGVAGGGLPD